MKHDRKLQDLRDLVQQKSSALHKAETEFHVWRKLRTPEQGADKNNFELEHWIERLSTARHEYQKAHREMVAASRDD